MLLTVVLQDSNNPRCKFQVLWVLPDLRQPLLSFFVLLNCVSNDVSNDVVSLTLSTFRRLKFRNGYLNLNLNLNLNDVGRLPLGIRLQLASKLKEVNDVCLPSVFLDIRLQLLQLLSELFLSVGLVNDANDVNDVNEVCSLPVDPTGIRQLWQRARTDTVVNDVWSLPFPRAKGRSKRCNLLSQIIMNNHLDILLHLEGASDP